MKETVVSENTPQEQLETVRGTVLSEAHQHRTASGRPYLLLTVEGEREGTSGREQYEVAVLDQMSQHEMQKVQSGDRVTVQGKHHQGEMVNESSENSTVPHRMVAYTAFIHRQPEDDMTREQFMEHVAALEDAARIEDEAEREMATTATDTGAEQSLQDFLEKYPAKRQGPSIEELEAQRVLTEQQLQRQAQHFGPEGLPF